MGKYYNKIESHTRKVRSDAVNDEAKYFKRVNSHTRSVPIKEDSIKDKLKRMLNLK